MTGWDLQEDQQLDRTVQELGIGKWRRIEKPIHTYIGYIHILLYMSIIVIRLYDPWRARILCQQRPSLSCPALFSFKFLFPFFPILNHIFKLLLSWSTNASYFTRVLKKKPFDKRVLITSLYVVQANQSRTLDFHNCLWALVLWRSYRRARRCVAQGTLGT